MKKYLPSLLLAAFIILLLIFMQKQGERALQAEKHDTIVQTNWIRARVDTITRTLRLPAPPPVETIESVFLYVDTAAILHDYNLVKIYERQLLNDDRAKLTLRDTLFQNRLLGGNLDAVFFEHDTTIYQVKYIHTLPEPLKNRVFVGVQAGMMMPDKVIIAPVLTLCTKKDHLYSIGYDPLNRAGFVSLGWKVKLRTHQRDVDIR